MQALNEKYLKEIRPSLQKELGRAVPMQEVKEVVKQNFEQIFGATLKD